MRDSDSVRKFKVRHTPKLPLPSLCRGVPDKRQAVTHVQHACVSRQHDSPAVQLVAAARCDGAIELLDVETGTVRASVPAAEIGAQLSTPGGEHLHISLGIGNRTSTLPRQASRACLPSAGGIEHPNAIRGMHFLTSNHQGPDGAPALLSVTHGGLVRIHGASSDSSTEHSHENWTELRTWKIPAGNVCCTVGAAAYSAG